MKTFIKLPVSVVEWECGAHLFDADNRPMWIDVPNEPYTAHILEMVRIINAIGVTEQKPTEE